MSETRRLTTACNRLLQSLAAITLAWGCAAEGPTAPLPVSSPSLSIQSVGTRPHYNLDVVLRAPARHEKGRGHIKFRQPVDNDFIIYLDTHVHRLGKNTTYTVQRAVDTVIDDNCTSEAWLTLGTITTDKHGTGFAALTRALPATNDGLTFDIHFRVVDAASVIALASRCYQFTVRR
jgi:hypothetical protein